MVLEGNVVISTNFLGGLLAVGIAVQHSALIVIPVMLIETLADGLRGSGSAGGSGGQRGHLHQLLGGPTGCVAQLCSALLPVTTPIMLTAALWQVGSEDQDLLVVLEGNVVISTNFLGGPLAVEAAHAPKSPNRSVAVPVDTTPSLTMVLFMLPLILLASRAMQRQDVSTAQLAWLPAGRFVYCVGAIIGELLTAWPVALSTADMGTCTRLL